ncbi:ATP-binding protein [Streptomyces sp. NPDC057638]|uniref:ATP-binding protein n=1 Tax=Streptomyces sp. NPDC057638 TaxID=3346190 RepID=UPI0036970A45
MHSPTAPVSLHDRTGELAAVTAAADRALVGARRRVTITGAPGVGRSAFLDAAATVVRGAGFTVLRGDGSRLERSLPHAVAQQLLCHAAGTGHDDLTAPGSPPDPELTGEPPRAALSRALARSGPTVARGPVAVLLDDAQWADEASLGWLSALLRAPGTAPLLLLSAVRDGDPAAEAPAVQDLVDGADDIVALRPLTADGVRAMLRERAVALPAEQARAWVRATGGNPALVASLLDRLGATARPTPARLLDAARSLPAPWNLRGRVAATLSSHPEPVRRFAYCAALLGGAAEDRLIARLAGLDQGDRATAAWALRRLGWAPDRCEPPLLWDCVREIAEDSHGPESWGDLHRRAAVLLHASGSPLERVATHLMEVGPGGHAPTADVLREAADDARRRGERHLAIRYLRRALREFPPSSPERGRFLAALAEAEQDIDPSALLRHVQQAIALLPTAKERAAVVAAVPLTLSLAASPVAHDLIAAARATLAPAEDPAAAELGARLEARARLAGLGRTDAPLDAVARLRELGPEPDLCTTARRERAAVLAFAGTVGGRLPSAEVGSLARLMLDREPAAAPSGYAATALMIASGTAAEAHEPVRNWLDTAVEAAGRRGDGRQRIRMLCGRALAAQQEGRLADAWTDARDACEETEGDLGDSDWLSALGLLSVAVELRDPWLTGHARAVCAGQRGAGAPVLQVGLLALRTATTGMSQLPSLAKELVEAVRRAGAAGWHNPALFPLAYWSTPALLRLGDTETALELIAHECDRARSWGSPATLGRTLRVWGTLVPGRYALSLLAESVAVLRESPNTLERARALMAYAMRLRGAGRSGAAELLAEADRIADTMGESLLRYWAEPGRGESGRVGLLGTERLSVTERRVAGLVALGRTNQDVAEELDVTRRAVEKCLTRLYRRLGVTSRAELIPVVRRIAGANAFRWGVPEGSA